jgi:iron complex outermembrane receptor protein
MPENMKTPTPASSPHHRPSFSRTSLLLLLPALGSLAIAQETPAPVTPPTEDDVVNLNAFTVSGERDSGYKASNSIAGTRSNTPIKDIPLNIQVFTKDLADDLVITSQIELERYNAALINGGADVHSDNLIQQAYNSFLFRGFVQNWGLRDGVREYDPIDSQGLARVEIVKGPAAALYGVTYPGGVMNNVTKEAVFDRSFSSIRLTTGTYGDYRGTIDSNYTATTAAGGKFAVRYNGAHAQTEDHREHSEGSVQYSQINLGWRPTNNTELKFLAERGYREKANGLGYFSRGETDSLGNSLGNSSDIPLQILHPQIPWDWNWATGSNMRSAETSLYRGAVTHAVSDDLVFNGYWQYAKRQNIDSNGWDASGPGSGASWDLYNTFPTGWIGNVGSDFIRMSYHYRDWNNATHAYGANAVYKFDISELKNTLTFGGNAWGERFHTRKWIQPTTSTYWLDFPIRTGITTYRPGTPPQDYYPITNEWGREDSSNDYYYASWQLSAFNNRLRTNVGVNRTNIKLINGTNLTELSKTSPMFGALFEVTPGVSIFAVHATSLFPTTDKNSFLQQLPPTIGKSYEGGVKLELLNGKISGTVSYYQITQEGGSQNDPTAFNLNQRTWDSLTPAQRLVQFPGQTRATLAGDLVAGGEQESKGFEADLVFQPTPNWQILLSFAHNNQEVTDAINKTTIGQSTTGHIENQIAALTKYSFTEGNVKGLSLGLGVQKAGEALQGYAGPNNTARYNPDTLYVETFASYKFKAFGHNQLIQLNVKNLTEQEEFVGWKATGSSRLATDRYEVPTKMRITLTYGIDF